MYWIKAVYYYTLAWNKNIIRIMIFELDQISFNGLLEKMMIDTLAQTQFFNFV